MGNNNIDPTSFNYSDLVDWTPFSNKIPEGQEIKQKRHRVPRACDACRKMKTKCIVLHSIPCETCKHASRPCTFEAIGVQRERPPTKREVHRINSRIRSLEKVLKALVPNIDLPSLTLTHEHSQLTMNSSKPSSSSSLAGKSGAESTTTQTESDALCDLDDMFRSIGHLHISPAEYIEDCQSATIPVRSAPSPWEKPDGSGEPDLVYYMTNENRSIVERTIELNYHRSVPNEHHYPPPDLAKSLIELYFEKVHPYEYILHKGEFMRAYDTGLVQTDNAFRALCYAVFAAASRFSSDFRVAPPLDGMKVDRQAAGAFYAAACTSLITPYTLPSTLFDIQAMAVLSYFLIGTSSPMTAWFSTGVFFRIAQDVGAHLAGTPRWETSIMKDQLRKRAFWFLYFREMQLSVSLGRTSLTHHTQITIANPLIVDDEGLSRFCEEHAGKTPQSIQELSQKNQIVYLTTRARKANFALYHLHHQFSRSLKTLFSIKAVPGSKACDWDLALVQEVAHSVDTHVRCEIPYEARWDPETSDEVDLVTTSRFECLLAYLQIIVHRHLIASNPHQELTACIAASKMMLNVIDHLKTRGLLELSATWTPYMITPATLTFIYAVSTRHEFLTAADRVEFYADAYRCLNILAALGPTTFQAEKLHASLAHLLKCCDEEILNPGSSLFGSLTLPRASDNSSLQFVSYPDTGIAPASCAPNALPPISGIAAGPSPFSADGCDVASLFSDPDASTSQVSLEFLSLAAPQLDASLFQYPGTGFNVPAPWEAPQWTPGFEPNPSLPAGHDGFMPSSHTDLSFNDGNARACDVSPLPDWPGRPL
ncbi:fungal-specific transcription factor domain-containing protein [Melampsora americana]|nr:fungal-specific transcription factor domain-containing protein [Melampsora americana]